MALTIDYQLTGSGWADCKVQSGDRSCQISASYLSDALGRLVIAASAVLAGAHSISVGFDEEPGEYRWVITNTGGNLWVSVSILSFPELWGARPDSEGEVMFSCSCDPLDFATAVRDAAQNVLDHNGITGYKKKWCEHEFPSEQLKLLDEAIARLNSNR